MESSGLQRRALVSLDAHLRLLAGMDLRDFQLIDPRADLVNDFGMKLSYADEGSNLGALGLTDADFQTDPDRRYAAASADRIESRRFGAQPSADGGVSRSS